MSDFRCVFGVLCVSAYFIYDGHASAARVIGAYLHISFSDYDKLCQILGVFLMYFVCRHISYMKLGHVSTARVNML